MSWRKIENFLNSNLGIFTLMALIAFIAGTAGASSGDNSSTDKKMSTNKKLLSQSEQTVKEQKDKIDELQAKIDEAAPYFEMKDEEKAKLEEQTKQEEKNREEQEKQEEQKREEQARQEEENRKNQEAAQKEAEEKARLEAKNKTLSSGNYEAGKDFEPGTYDIVAVSGGGNVYSSNSYEGGINAILGSDEKIAEEASIGMRDMYKKDYKNVELPKGTKLKIDGVEVKLVAKN